MAKVDGCWANVLDDCDGPLTAEHLVSVAVWEPAAGAKDNRDARLQREVTVRGGPDQSPPTTVPLEELTAHILCRHHNSSSHALDEAGGEFRRALREYMDEIVLRHEIPGRPRTALRRTVHGPLIERWFLKTAINNAVRFKMPIGSSNASPGQPSRELAELVYGERSIQRPIGLCSLQWVGNQINFGNEEFSSFTTTETTVIFRVHCRLPNVGVRSKI